MDLTIKQQLLLMLTQYSYQDCWDYLHYYLQQPNNLHRLDIPSFNHVLANLHQEKYLKTFHILKEVDSLLLHEWNEQSFMIGERHYPTYWYHIPKPPLIIFHQGNVDILKKPSVSIIGTRSITPYGIEMSRTISQAIVEKGWATVSGLAKGVDSVVHQSSLSTRQQSTIAIIPNGYDITYPLANASLKTNIKNHGLILSEYLPQTPVRKFQFIMRNRLVAGLCPVTIIIEAAKKSGSLITAHYALQFNREIIALPGPINSNTSQGCNELIYQGARPIQSIPQLIEDLEWIFENQALYEKKI